jgi:hypothetical protein
MVYNEMIETWGSFLVLAKYKAFGKLTNSNEASSQWSMLKKYLLFDIDRSAFNEMAP